MNAHDPCAGRIVHLPALLFSWLLIAAGVAVVWLDTRDSDSVGLPHPRVGDNR